NIEGATGGEVDDEAADLGIRLLTERRRKKASKSESMEAVRRAILWYVQRVRPTTIGLLKHLLPIKAPLLDLAIEELEEEGNLLLIDLPGGERALLPPGTTLETLGDVISQEDLNKYRFQRSGGELSSWEEYIDRFWGFRSPYEVLSRVKGLSLKTVIDSIINEEVLPLSWGGTTVFTHRRKLQHFLALKEKVDLGVYQRRALRILSTRNISNHWELGKNMKIPAKSAETLLNGLQELGLAIKPDAFFRELTGLKGHIKPTLGYLTPSERAALEGVERDNIGAEALLQILTSLGPLTINEISNYTGLNTGRTRELLDILLREGKVDVGMVKGAGVVPIFGVKGWKEEFRKVRDRPGVPVRAYTSEDPLLRAYLSTRPRGRDQITVYVVKGGDVVALLQIVEESDRVHIKNFEIYDLKNVREIVGSLQPLLEYLEESGQFMITLKKVLGLEGDEISPQIKRLLKEQGFSLTGRIWVRGISAESIDSDSTLYEISSILKRQKLLKEYHIKHPVELLLLWGNIRDDWEVLSRMGGVYYAEVPQREAIKKLDEAGRRLILAAKIIDEAPDDAVKLIFTSHNIEKYTGRMKVFYTMKELARQYGLLRGYFFPGTLAWGSLQHALLYRSAISMEIQNEEEGILNLFKSGRSLTLTEIKSRSPLSHERVKEAVESLLKGGVLYKDSYGRYITLPDVEIPSKGASITLLLNEIATLIPFRASKLKSYLGYPIRGYEIREALRMGTHHGPLKPYVDGSGVLWGEDEIEEFRMGEDEIVILSPRDRLFNYFREEVRSLFGDDYLYPVFRGGEIVGAVKMKKRGRELSDMKIIGGRRVSMREVLAYLKEYRFRM
ncbi:MAG: hypothetical protein J7L88_00475, partial [Thermoplasmata archaeon]|nr:hypothetical protein [Thermoplasmata archaeon]